MAINHGLDGPGLFHIAHDTDRPRTRVFLLGGAGVYRQAVRHLRRWKTGKMPRNIE